MHPVNIEDVPAISDRLALAGLVVFALLTVGICVYLIRKLPRGDNGPNDDGPGVDPPGPFRP